MLSVQHNGAALNRTCQQLNLDAAIFFLMFFFFPEQALNLAGAGHHPPSSPGSPGSPCSHHLPIPWLCLAPVACHHAGW